MNDSVLIVGTGALATYFAACFSKAGYRVMVLGNWSEGINALNTQGARIEGESNGHQVFATNDPLKCTDCQINLVLVKSWQTKIAAYKLQKCILDNSLVITLQNGIGNQATLSDILLKTKVVQCITTMGVTLLAPGIVRLAGQGPIYSEESYELKNWHSILIRSGFQVTMVPDILPYVWGKLIINSAINPLSAILGTPNGEILALPAARLLFEKLVLESTSVATALGISLPFIDSVDAARAVVHQTSTNYSSMLQDVNRGSRTEIDSINGEIIRLANELGLHVPINKAITDLVQSIPVRGNIG